MPVSLQVNLDELKLALARAQADRPDRCFVNHPHLLHWIELDSSQWLSTLQIELQNGYVPKPCHLCQIPKADSMLRPGSVLDIHDEVVYNTLVGRLFPKIRQQIAQFQGDPDVAYQLADDDAAPKWVRSDFLVWKQWRQRSLGKLNAGHSHVVLTDITGFYDNIDISRLLSDLRRICTQSHELDLLSECLYKWTVPRGKGIPQGYSASDILAKVYLNVVDRSLINGGYSHLRYVDDIRIFTQSRLQAKQAIKRLSLLMHQRGLNLQTAKTQILSKIDATKEFDGVAGIINDVQRQLATELGEDGGSGDVSLSAGEISQMLEEAGHDTGESGPEVLERTFTDWFGVPGLQEFHKTLFHYLLTRLAKVGSKIAVDYCIAALRNRPEETEYILRYIGAVGTDARQLQDILLYMQSPEAIYDYQLYQIVRWFYHSESNNPTVLAICRLWAYDHNRDLCLRSYAYAYLGKYGDSSDMESIEQHYSMASSDLERGDHIAALARHENSRRNEFYGRVRVDCELVRLAVQLARRSST